MFYHVRIDYFDKKLKANQTLYEYDYSSEEEVLEKLVIPYVAERRIIFAGTILDAEDRRQLRVYETEHNIESMVDYANQHVNPRVVFVYHNSDVVASNKYAKDITKDLTQRALLTVEESKEKESSQGVQEENKKPLLFISHSSLDKEFVEALVTLLESMGFDNTTLFCSSVPDYWIGLSQNIFESLRSLFNEHELYVIFVQSPRYYRSAVSLNEMGAAWVLRNDGCSILTKDMTKDKMQGVVNSSTIYIKVDTSEAGPYLNELKKTLTNIFKLPSMTDTTWERKRNTFLKAVNAIEYTEEQVINPTPLDDEYKRLQVEELKQKAIEKKQAKVRGNIIEGRSRGTRILRIFNAGQSKAKDVTVEWLNPDDLVMVQWEFGLLGEISPQSSRSINMALCEGHPETMRLRYTWADENEDNNTYEEDVQI